MVNHKKLSWAIKWLKANKDIECDNIQFSEKNDLSKNICVNIKLYWNAYVFEYTKLVYWKTFCIYLSFLKFHWQFYVILYCSESYFSISITYLFIYLYVNIYIYMYFLPSKTLIFVCIIKHFKKSLLHNDNEHWKKKNTKSKKLFRRHHGSFDGAKICELVDIHIRSYYQRDLINNLLDCIGMMEW